MQFHQRAAAAHPRLYPESDLVSWVEPGSGLIRIIGRGQWCEAQVAVHFTALRNLILQRRAEGGAVRVMVDLRESEVQDMGTADRISKGTSTLYTEQDRVAIIVESSTLRSQLKTAVSVDNVAYFLAPTAARIWLNAMWLSAPPEGTRRSADAPSRWLMSA